MRYFLPDVAHFPILSFAVIVIVCRHLDFGTVPRHFDFGADTRLKQVTCHFKHVFRLGLGVRVRRIAVSFPRVIGFILFV
jgi:hypothetical protein